MKHISKKQSTQLATLLTNYNLKTINECTSLTVRANTLLQVWNSNEPTFNAVKRELGIDELKKLLYIEIGKMVALLKADLGEMQISYFADYIIQHYPSYTISDLTTLTNIIVTSKIAESWGKPSIQNLINELDQYSIEKQEFAVRERIKEASKLKADPVKEKKFNEMYQRLKRKAKEPIKTQKEIDKENKFINDEKIKELKRLYPSMK